LTEGLKSFLSGKVPEIQLSKVVVPISVIGFSLVLYIAFSYLYPPIILRDIVIQGLILGFVSSGVYSMGKAVIEPVPAPA